MYTDEKQWTRIRDRIMELGESINFVARSEGVSRNTVRKMLRYKKPLKYGNKTTVDNTQEDFWASRISENTSSDLDKSEWMDMLYALETGGDTVPPEVDSILPFLNTKSRRKALVVIAKICGFSNNSISRHLCISRNTVRNYLLGHSKFGDDFFSQKSTRIKLSDDPDLKKQLFALLHEPPNLSGINRSTWRIKDLRKAISSKGYEVCERVISRIISESGYQGKNARVVLTSNDPEYREKLANIQRILSNLKKDELFFSIDEFGPFSIKKKAGRRIVKKDEQPSVPQWQKSKGWLILTAGIELSTNQVTHFYSRAKNTAEMIKMIELLVEKYSDASKLYISWDTASWHLSKQLEQYIENHNQYSDNNKPTIELAPLPASAQFLNVIESIFSGMARGIIHNSDYSSVEDAKNAIDCYFAERNDYFMKNPKRSGNKIWGKEQTPSKFLESNNCKDPLYR
jgi:transposase